MKNLSCIYILQLNKGGFSDSVKIKKTKKKKADLYYFNNKNHLQSIVELINNQAKGVKCWRLLKNGETTESLVEAVKDAKIT